MKTLLLATYLIALPLMANAGLTVDQATDEAMSQSPEIQRIKAVENESDWAKTEALGSGFLPKVSANGHHYLSEKYTNTDIVFGGTAMTFPGFYPVDSAAIDMQIPIFDGFSSTRNWQAADLAHAAARAELEHAQFTLKQDIRLAFYQALAAIQLQAVATENIKTLEDHLKQTEIQKRAGVARTYDLLRVQVQLSDARSEAVDADDNVISTRKKLNTLLGLENDDRPLEGQLPEADSKTVSHLQWTDVPTERTDIQALNLRAEAAHKRLQASSTWFVPSIYVQGEYMWYNQQNMTATGTIDNTNHFPDAYSVGVFFNWNLFDGGVSYARDQEAVARQTQAEKTAQATKIQAPADFDYWKRRYISNTNKYQAKQLDVQRSLESVRLAKEEEKAGSRTSTETLDAELDLFRSRAGVVNALMNALEAKVKLENTLGREL